MVAIFIGEVIGIFTPASNFSIGFAFAPETFPVFVIVEVISLIIFLDIVRIIIKKSRPNEALIINIKKYRRINFIFLFFISMSFAGAIFSYGAAYLAFEIMGSFFRGFYIALFITTCMTIFFIRYYVKNKELLAFVLSKGFHKVFLLGVWLAPLFLTICAMLVFKNTSITLETLYFCSVLSLIFSLIFSIEFYALFFIVKLIRDSRGIEINTSKTKKYKIAVILFICVLYVLFVASMVPEFDKIHVRF